ncbi:hypothetical protein [Clostridium sp.]|uniref:hypothetical protein n=1 Tax=Clostridium sp. TaxID=1506 RepID=UPI0032168961
MKKHNRIVFKFLSALFVLLLIISNNTAFATTEVSPYAVVPDSCPYYGSHRAVVIRYDHGNWTNLGPSDRMTYLYECDCGAKIVCTGHPSDPNGIVGYYSTNYNLYTSGYYRFLIYGSSYSTSNRLFDWVFY